MNIGTYVQHVCLIVVGVDSEQEVYTYLIMCATSF